MKQLLHNTKRLSALLTLAALLALPGMGWGTTVTHTFSATSGNIDGNISFACQQNNSATAPAFNTNLRLYYAANGNGCSITLTPANGAIISQVVITAVSSYTPTVKYNVDGGGDANATLNSLIYTISGITASSSLKIRNANTTNTQLRITTIEVTYSATVPLITVGTLASFGDVVVNNQSVQQIYNVSGSNLTDNILVTPPSGFLISTTNGSGYASTPVTLTQSSGSVGSTPIYVVFNPTAAQTYSGNITHQSTGATTQNVAVTGTGTNPPPPDAPTATAATSVSSSGFTANWDAVSGATGYRLDVYTITAGMNASDLFISEYIEGSGNNKAIEIYNGTGSTKNLANYTIVHFNNGASRTSGTRYALTFSDPTNLDNGATYVIANSGSSQGILNLANLSTNNSVLNFNGDDALAIYNSSDVAGTTIGPAAVEIDIFGKIGVDPGSEWGTGLISTADNTLQRKSSIFSGVTINPDNFDPSIEYNGYATDYIDGLGSHTFDGGSSQVFVDGYENLDVEDVTSYEVTGLDASTTYYYEVRAYNNYGSSASSNEIEVTTSLPEPTNYPTDFAATASVNRQLTVTWVDATTGDQLPEAYLVKAAVYPGTPTPPVDGTFEANSELVLNVAQGTQTATFSDLMAGTKYNFAIWPYTNEGTEVDYKTGAQPTTSANTLIIPSTFTGTGNWSEAGKWSNGIPEYDYLAIINGSVTVDNTVMVDSLIIAPTGRVTVHPDGYLNAMRFLIQSDASGTGSFIGDEEDYIVPANSKVKHYISGAPESWHLISSPVGNPSPQSISGEFTPSGTYNDGSGYDFYAWDEPSSFWLNQKVGINNILFFWPLEGYLVSYQATNPTKTFSGYLTRGIQSFTLSAFGFSGEDKYPYTNLIGNPYPSSIDWKASDAYDKSQLEGYGTTGVNAYVYNDAANNYGVYNDQSSSDEGTNGASRYIAPMQGFFVIANGSGAHNQSFLIDDDARVHSPQSWLKSSDGQGFRLSVNAPGTNGSDQLLLEFGHETTVGAAEKWNSFVNTAPALYTSMNGKKYSISFLTSVGDHPVVPVALKPGVDGNYSLTADFNTGVFTKVTLTDSKTGASHDLKNNPVYSFTASVSDDENRFALHFSTVGISTPETSSIQVYSLEGRLYVNGAPANAQLSLTDITGRLVQRTQLENNGLNTVNVGNLPHGVYVVTVNDGKHLVSHKIIL